MSETTSPAAVTTTEPSETTTVATPTATSTPAPVTQRYIQYRTADLMYQPHYTYVAGASDTAPAPQVASPKGTVIGEMMLTSLKGVTPAAGCAFALDDDSKYPVGSIYTPPAVTPAAAPENTV